MRIGLSLLFLLYAATSMADVFTYEVERAGYGFGQSDKKGEITYDAFVREFRAFPWIDEIERWKSQRKGVSPTLSVLNLNRPTAYWVSMAGDKTRHAYLLGIEYRKSVKPVFATGREVNWIEIFITEDQRVVEETFALFFKGESDQLMTALRRLPKFDEMESKRGTYSR